MSIYRNEDVKEKVKVETIQKSCPICKGDVKGDDVYLFYCKSCNILFKRDELMLSKERVADIVKEKIAEKYDKELITLDIEPIEIKKPKIIYYFASKKSNKVHASNCPYGKNIKSNNRIRFKSLNGASNYKRCKCVEV